MIDKEEACRENPDLLALCFPWLSVFRAFLEALSFFLAHGVLNLAFGALGGLAARHRGTGISMGILLYLEPDSLATAPPRSYIKCIS
jgi:hypothetical protein